MSEAPENDIGNVVREKIENLRRSLLDLSASNPLISTKFGNRSNSYLRVVDELPDQLLSELVTDRNMAFKALPSLNEDPADEAGYEFQNYLTNALISDPVYLDAIDEINPDNDDSSEQLRMIERRLKDRIREELEMPPRQTEHDTSLAQHARNNNISPSFELPHQSEQHEDGRHEDDEIQTLLLPENLDRTMTRMLTKFRTWEQETGINVFHAAFGFVEWGDENKKQLSPLVLLKIRTERERTPNGPVYRVYNAGEDPTSNKVLEEALNRRYEMALPTYSGGAIEDYLQQIDALTPAGINWKVRRFIAFGVFPSARMSMYEDLAPENLIDSEIVTSLLAGAANADALPLADDDETDDPEIERNILLVSDADSSQVNVVAKARNGHNLAVEGPPGTGKSQTIVNTIADALVEGKKVLFVAEKVAALDVVRARLEAMELGSFLLPLQANRSNREVIIQSLRDRLEMVPSPAPENIEAVRGEFNRARYQLEKYIEILSSNYGESEITVHEVLGRSIKTSEKLSNASETLPATLLRPNIKDIRHINEIDISEVQAASQELTEAWNKAAACDQSWSNLSIPLMDRFTIESILSDADEAAKAFTGVQEKWDTFLESILPQEIEMTQISDFWELADNILQRLADVDIELIERLVYHGIEPVWSFLHECDGLRPKAVELYNIFGQNPDVSIIDRLSELLLVIEKHNIETLDINIFNNKITHHSSKMKNIEKNLDAIDKLLTAIPSLDATKISDIRSARILVQDTPQEILFIRSQPIADPNLRGVMRRLIEEGQKLREEYDDLMVKLRITDALQISEIQDAAVTIRTTGFFGRLGSRYQNAKKLYRRLNRSISFDRETASSLLERLGQWMLDCDAFHTDLQAQSIFGHHFRVFVTDWKPFVDAIAYCEKVDEEFSDLNQTAIRDFLLHGESFHLKALPEISAESDDITTGMLRGRYDQMLQDADHWMKARDALDSSVSVLANPCRHSVSDVNGLRDDVSQYLEAKEKLEKPGLASSILGHHFQGVETERDKIDQEIAVATDLCDADPVCGTLVLSLSKRDALGIAMQKADTFMTFRDQAHSRIDDLFNCTGINFLSNPEEPTHEIVNRLKIAAKDHDGVMAYSEYRVAYQLLESTRFAWVADAMLEAGITLDDLCFISEAVIYRAMAIDIYQKYGTELNQFSGRKLDKLREQLAQTDRKLLELNRKEIQAKVLRGADPPSGISQGRVRDYTEMGLINHEINKERRFVSPRELTRRAGQALQEIKPCWMMSPLAISHYVEKRDLSFDICIIDEASQMPPENAVGALMRSKQAMIVGDTNQLPPTSFFRTMLRDDEDDEDETVLSDSILELANATFRPKQRLRWHYRSRHSGLIHFSNHHIYDNDLIVFPGPSENASDTGVSFVNVNGGLYKNGTNPIEADAVVKKVLEFMGSKPEKSLGIVTLNQKQRDLVIEMLEHAIDSNPDAKRYVGSWQDKRDGLETYFVKNLENVQGDERDVIFISTVYGPETLNGPVANRFGPINGIAGRRRLNVLFSRAKHEIVTFSSMTAQDVRADEAGNAGAFLLKRWLEYSKTGRLEAGTETRRPPDSAFEEYVIDQIVAMGCDAVPQVGVGGYFIDIGVSHPDWPHGFLLGVECDGASYHSSRSARDRDRLRQEVLEGLGWRLYRIWSTDWFQNPGSEAEKLRNHIKSMLETEMETQVEPDAAAFPQEPEETPPAVQVGDTVQIRYLDQDGSRLRFTISDGEHDPNNGLVNAGQPLAQALLDAEVGEEVEILVGIYSRKAVIEEIESIDVDR